jgi:glycosyltransferase involved in cell wall biosynthesis
MRQSPIGSVVIPVRNGRDVLVHQLNALVSQTIVERLELIIIDDASTDGTAEVADRWLAAHSELDVRVIRRTERGGPNASRNDGIRAARSEVILLCDGDDVVASDWAQRLLEALAPHPEQRLLVTGRLVQLLGDDQLGKETIFDLMSYEGIPHIFGGNAAFRRDLALEIGGFDEQIFSGGTEVDFSLRAIARGAGVVYVPEARVGYRIPTSLLPSFSREFRACRGHEYLRHQNYFHRSGPPPLSSYLHPWKRLVSEVFSTIRGKPNRKVLGRLSARAVGATWWGLVFRFRLPPKRLASDLQH